MSDLKRVKNLLSDMLGDIGSKGAFSLRKEEFDLLEVVIGRLEKDVRRLRRARNAAHKLARKAPPVGHECPTGDHHCAA